LAKSREQESGVVPEEKKDEEKSQPNPQLEQGATLPARMGEFPPEMFGLPIEDVDEYYFNKYVRISVFLLPTPTMSVSMGKAFYCSIYLFVCLSAA